MNDKTVQPIEQKQVDFYGDELTAVRLEDGSIYVAIRHMCEALGIDTQGQTRRIKRNEVLEGGYSWVDILSTQPNPQWQQINKLKILNNGLGVCKLATPYGGATAGPFLIQGIVNADHKSSTVMVLGWAV